MTPSGEDSLLGIEDGGLVDPLADGPVERRVEEGDAEDTVKQDVVLEG